MPRIDFGCDIKTKPMDIKQEFYTISLNITEPQYRAMPELSSSPPVTIASTILPKVSEGDSFLSNRESSPLYPVFS